MHIFMYVSTYEHYLRKHEGRVFVSTLYFCACMNNNMHEPMLALICLCLLGLIGPSIEHYFSYSCLRISLLHHSTQNKRLTQVMTLIYKPFHSAVLLGTSLGEEVFLVLLSQPLRDL